MSLKVLEAVDVPPQVYISRIQTIDSIDRLQSDHQSLHAKWNQIIEDPNVTVVDGWTQRTLKAAHDLVVERLQNLIFKQRGREYQHESPMDLEEQAKILAPLLKQRQIVSPDEIPPLNELGPLFAGIDFGYRASGLLIMAHFMDMFWVIEERNPKEKTAEQFADICKEVEAKFDQSIQFFSGADAPEIVKTLQERGLNVEIVETSLRRGIPVLQGIFEADQIRITSTVEELLNEIESYRWPTRRGAILKQNPQGKSDSIDALRYALMGYGATSQTVSESEEFMPIRPSGKSKGPRIDLPEVLDQIKPFKIVEDFVTLTGGLVNNRKTFGDIEIYIEPLQWEKLKRIVKFRLYRGLKKELAERLHFLPYETGGVFTSHVQLGDLIFKPKENFTRVAMSFQESFRSASKEIKRQAEESKEKDSISINRMFYPLKPWRGAYEGKHQTIENFLEVVPEEIFPALVSKKFDGNTFIVFKDGNQVRIFSDDGLENTKHFPTVIERVKKLKPDKLIFVAEFERWVNGVHYPRESVRQVITEEVDDSNIVVNIFEALYYSGRDIHKKNPFQRNRYGLKLEVDESTNEVPQEDTVLNLVPQFRVESIEELTELTEELSEKPSSEGVVVKSGLYSLERQADQASAIKYHKAGWVNAVVLERISTKTEGIYNYRYGLPYPDIDQEPVEVVDNYVVVGKTFNTALKLSKGDLIDIEFETLNFTEDLDKDKFDISFWVPTLVKEASNSPHTVSEAIKRAKNAGVYQPKWIKEDETYYDKSLLTEAIHVPVTAQFQAQDPYMEWPAKPNQKQKFATHAHFRGKSLHFDSRREVIPKEWLIGWTVDVQREEAITENVTTVKQAKKICKGYKLKEGNKYLKPMYAAGDGQQLVLQEKSPEPYEWISYEGIVKPGSVGATRFNPGVFYIMDQGICEWGTQKPAFHEYFNSGGEVFNGIFVARLLKNVWGPKTGEYEFVWMGWYTQDPVPYVVSKRAVEKDYMPPDGYSALPQVLMKEVPKDLRFWEHSGKSAKKLRKQLVEEGIFTEDTCGFNEKNELNYKGE